MLQSAEQNIWELWKHKNYFSDITFHQKFLNYELRILSLVLRNEKEKCFVLSRKFSQAKAVVLKKEKQICS